MIVGRGRHEAWRSYWGNWLPSHFLEVFRRDLPSSSSSGVVNKQYMRSRDYWKMIVACVGELRGPCNCEGEGDRQWKDRNTPNLIGRVTVSLTRQHHAS